MQHLFYALAFRRISTMSLKRHKKERKRASFNLCLPKKKRLLSIGTNRRQIAFMTSIFKNYCRKWRQKNSEKTISIYFFATFLFSFSTPVKDCEGLLFPLLLSFFFLALSVQDCSFFFDSHSLCDIINEILFADKRLTRSFFKDFSPFIYSCRQMISTFIAFSYNSSFVKNC